MRTKLILDRIEFNIIPYPVGSGEPKAARLHYNRKQKNENKIIEILKSINHKHGTTRIKEYMSETEINQFGQPLIVQIGNENWNYKIPSYVLNVKHLEITNNKEDTVAFLEAQSLIFRVYGSNFDKYITFKFKRDWKNTQGELETNCYKFYSLIQNELIKNNLIIEAEIQKDKKTGYYLIKKIIPTIKN